MFVFEDGNVVKKNSVEEGDGRWDLNRANLTEKVMRVWT